jgi:hypothetical protein
MLEKTTVKDDGFADTMTGGDGMNWVFVSKLGQDSTDSVQKMDKITNLASHRMDLTQDGIVNSSQPYATHDLHSADFTEADSSNALVELRRRTAVNCQSSRKRCCTTRHGCCSEFHYKGLGQRNFLR